MTHDHDHDHEHGHGEGCGCGHLHVTHHGVRADEPAEEAPEPVAAGDDDPDRLAEELADATARMAGQLGWAIQAFRARTGFSLAGAPVAVVFERADYRAAKPKHRSGQLSPELLPFLVDATLRARTRLGYLDGEDNPYLIALVLACFYTVESARTNSGVLGLTPQTRRRLPTVEVLQGDDATADIRGVPGTAMLRTIVPVEPDEGEALVTGVQFEWRG
jgi:hypothetical protein